MTSTTSEASPVGSSEPRAAWWRSRWLQAAGSLAVVAWGIPVAQTTLATVVSGVWNNVVKLGLPVVALALLAMSGGAGTARMAAALIGLAVLLYRALTWLLPIPMGVGCWLFWRANTSWRRSVEDRRGARHVENERTVEVQPADARP